MSDEDVPRAPSMLRAVSRSSVHVRVRPEGAETAGCGRQPWCQVTSVLAVVTPMALCRTGLAGSSARAGKSRGLGPRAGGVTATAGKLSRFAPSELQASAARSFAIPGVL